MTRIRNKIFLTVVTVILFLCSASYGFAFSGKCIRVADGDTIVVLTGNDKIKVRLYGVDCPETDQRYGKKAKLFTSKHVLDRTLRIERKGKSYNRIVGIVNAKDFCLNSSLLKSGYAWHSTKYCKASFCQSWKSIELAAKRTFVGLWSDPDPIPPWDFRSKTSVKNNGGCFRGNIASKKFHRKGCKYFNCRDCSVVFKTSREAIKKGFVACRICMS